MEDTLKIKMDIFSIYKKNNENIFMKISNLVFVSNVSSKYTVFMHDPSNCPNFKWLLYYFVLRIFSQKFFRISLTSLLVSITICISNWPHSI